MATGTAVTDYDAVIRQFDALLAAHGYQREGRLYRAVAPNHDTLVFFCHFALECVLLSRLINASPMVLWHGLCAAPSSVTTVATEERRPGAAYFRVLQFGDISHLYAHGEPTLSWPASGSAPATPPSTKHKKELRSLGGTHFCAQSRDRNSFP